MIENAYDNMLAGMASTGPTMFPTLQTSMAPSAKEMEELQKDAMFNRHVAMKGVYVKTFDLSIKKQAKEYQDLMSIIYRGVTERTHAILFSDRQFVSTDKPRWVAHVEWMEFQLKIDRIKAIGANNGQSKSV